MTNESPRAIAVVDVGYTNSKVMLFAPDLKLVAERKIASPHHRGQHYGEIDVEPMLAFISTSLAELDRIAPIDVISTSAHGACIVAAGADGRPCVPVMDYMSEPPPEIVADYARLCPSFAETFSPQLPVALLHAMQLFWQQRVMPEAFARATHILPLMQYAAMRLGGRPVTEISAMGCQSHLLDLNTLGPSSLASAQGWAAKFAPPAKAWDVIGNHEGLRGQGKILAGIHDSNANYLRYLAAGIGHFTLLSTGTWIIGFDTKADVKALDHTRDIVANVDVMGRVVACSRFFGGKEFEIVAAGETAASMEDVASLLASGVMALPSFTGSGGPMPDTGHKGRMTGGVKPGQRASLASLYCALMVSESLDALTSRGAIIVDGPFSQNACFLALLAALRPAQKLMASNIKDGTAAGAACLALMPDGRLPHVEADLAQIAPQALPGLADYQQRWRNLARRPSMPAAAVTQTLSP